MKVVFSSSDQQFLLSQSFASFPLHMYSLDNSGELRLPCNRKHFNQAWLRKSALTHWGLIRWKGEEQKHKSTKQERNSKKSGVQRNWHVEFVFKKNDTFTLMYHFLFKVCHKILSFIKSYRKTVQMITVHTYKQAIWQTSLSCLLDVY